MEYNTHFTILYDADEQLYYTKVGVLEPVNGICPLHYTVWGKTKQECIQRATNLVYRLSINITVHP